MKLTEYIAIYAALLSTLVFVWNIRNSWPRVTVEIVLGTKENDHGVHIFIKNPSSQTVNIQSVSPLFPFQRLTIIKRLKYVCRFKRFRYVDWAHGRFDDEIVTGLPTSIAPQNAHSIFIPDKKIRGMLRRNRATRFAAVVQDALWRNKYSAPFQF